ncbi:monovalent cation/H+ antiporter subunit D [Roseovarius salis]|uniref:monovalent cation/H+ antiporter subunit D n=1 Tax=Roseovarius salis TaxID=3376063 RepID=UPI0037C8A936
MSHWIIAPVILPAMMAAFIVLVLRFHPGVQRVFSLGGALAVLAIAAGLLREVSDGTILLYQLGNWAAPFGIVLVGDRLSMLFVVLTALLAVMVLLYAIGSGWDMRGRNFHALFQFQLMGIAGAFLTGDAFNLFVFFEVLLIASYGLMIHSGGAARFRAGMQYVVFNLLGSTLFLFALGTIYAETGTLNMADLAQRVAAIPAEEAAGIRAAAVLLLLVFAVKAAILPLHFWLPASYAEAPAPVAALFAIMTKVGAYSIIRFYTLVFPPDLAITQGLFDTWLLPAALLTVAVGTIGVLGARRLDRLVAFAVIGSMGMLMSALAVFTPEGIAAALYYAVHSTLATAALFLLVDVVRERRGAQGVTLAAAPPIAGGALVAALFFAAAIAMAGLPPLSGFVGKLLILDATVSDPRAAWIWAVVLVGSLVAVIGFARAGSTVFWKAHADDVPTDEEARAVQAAADRPALPLVAIGGVLALLVAVTVFAGPVQRYMAATTQQLFAPAPYVTTVLETPGRQITYKGKSGGHAETAGDAGDHAGEDH